MNNEELIDKANHINQSLEALGCSEQIVKEVKKVEMYVRKTYLMLKFTDDLIDNKLTEDEYITMMNAALVRDQKYVKARDSLDTYSIL